MVGARITIVIDIGFGVAIKPGVEEISLPVLLDLPYPGCTRMHGKQSSWRNLRQWSCSVLPTPG